MPTPIPAWVNTDLSGSLRRHATWLNELARETFLTDKLHIELFFLLKQDGQGGIAQPPSEMDRDQFVSLLKHSIQENDIYGVIHICETWSFFPKVPNDHTMKQITQGEIAVSDLKPEDKTEALMVRVECRDGTQHLWLNPIVRSKDAVFLSDAIELDEPLKGRFGTFFGVSGSDS